jgi:hypothetical protein
LATAGEAIAFPQALIHGAARHARGFGDERLSPMAQGFGFGDGPESATSLIEHRLQDGQLVTKACYHFFLAHTIITGHQDKSYIYVSNLFTDRSL